MDDDGKKPLTIAILEFYKLNLNKGKEYTIKHFKKSVHRVQSIDGYSLNYLLKIAIKNLYTEPEKQLNIICKGEFMPKIFLQIGLKSLLKF